MAGVGLLVVREADKALEEEQGALGAGDHNRGQIGVVHLSAPPPAQVDVLLLPACGSDWRQVNREGLHRCVPPAMIAFATLQGIPAGFLVIWGKVRF